MKSFLILTLAATLVVANAETCDLIKISPLLVSTDVPTCTLNSGFSFTTLAPPSAEALPKICASTACKNVLAAVKALNLGDCTLVGVRLETDLIMPIEKACESNSSSASNSTTAGSMAGNMTTTTTTPTPIVTNKTSSGSGTASPSSENTLAPSTTPTPTPTSSASSVTLATTAVIVVIAAAIF